MKVMFALLLLFQYCIGLASGDHIDNITVCSTELDDQLWNTMSSQGSCEPYIQTNRQSFCDMIFDSTDYIYIPKARLNGSQLQLRFFAEEINTFLFSIPQKCLDILVGLLCTHYYLPCGRNGTKHVPLSVCPDVCNYVFAECSDIWQFAVSFLDSDSVLPQYRNNEAVKPPQCNDTDKIISFLNLSSDCCSNGGIVLPEQPSTRRSISTTISVLSVSSQYSATLMMSSSISNEMTLSHTSPTVLATNTAADEATSLILAVSVTSAVLLLIVVISVIAVTLICLKWRRRKLMAMEKQSMIKMQQLGALDPELSTRYTKTRTGVEEMKELTVSREGRPRVSSMYLRQLSHYIISGSTLALQETIGQGEFGIVYRAVMTTDNKGIPIPVAVKTLKGLFSKSDIESIMEECLKMSSFDHRHVLPLIGVCLELGPAPYIIMPFMERGSLLSYLKKERPNLTVADGSDEDIVLNVRKHLISICLQVAEGMAYLALQKFVHRDLAARNCMIDSGGVIKVADFGLSEDVYSRNYFRQLKDSSDSSSTSVIKLPVKWMATESLHDGLFSEKSDVWSFGVLCWEVFSLGKAPYPGLDPLGVVELLDSGGRLQFPLNAACSKEIYTLMLSCWNESSNLRPSFNDLVDSLNDIIKPLAGYMDFTDIATTDDST